MKLFTNKVAKEVEEGVSEDENGEKVGSKKFFKKKKSSAGYSGKDLKDLSSSNKKARREPKKPWGQAERLLVLVVVLLTAGLSAYLWLGSVGWQLPKIPKVNFSIPNIFTEETIILEKDR